MSKESNDLKLTAREVCNFLKKYLENCGNTPATYVFKREKTKTHISLLAGIDHTVVSFDQVKKSSILYSFSIDHTVVSFDPNPYDLLKLENFNVKGSGNFFGGIGFNFFIPRTYKRGEFLFESVYFKEKAAGKDPTDSRYLPEIKIDVSYLKTNILGKYNFTTGKNSPYVVFGVPIGLVLSNKSVRIYNSTTGVPLSKPTIYPFLDKFFNSEFSLLTGLGVKIGPINLDARYEFSGGFASAFGHKTNFRRFMLVAGYRIR
jgi:hypothetical protein